VVQSGDSDQFKNYYNSNRVSVESAVQDAKRIKVDEASLKKKLQGKHVDKQAVVNLGELETIL